MLVGRTGGLNAKETSRTTWKWLSVEISICCRPPLANDIRLLSKCRFKPRPETEKEKADCKTQLLGPDTAKVSACRYLDFGQVALGQSEVQHFAVTNGLSQNLLVKLDITEEDCDELEEITPKTQVVPPGATAAFSCRFTASNPGTFEYEVPYTINGQRYTFKTTADVVPVRVELNVEKLHFQFSPDNWTGRVDHMLGMENPFDFPVVFNVESTNNVFSVEPARGVLDPRGKLSVRVRWAPVANDTVGNNKGNLIVHVRGELKPKKVACQGELPEGRMQLVGEKHIDFDVVAVGVPKSKVVVLRNLAPHESQFQVLLANPALRASPTFGRVPAKGSLEIEITVAAEEPCAIEETLFIDVRGGRQIKVPTRGKGDISPRSKPRTLGSRLSVFSQLRANRLCQINPSDQHVKREHHRDLEPPIAFAKVPLTLMCLVASQWWCRTSSSRKICSVLAESSLGAPARCRSLS